MFEENRAGVVLLGRVAGLASAPPVLSFLSTPAVMMRPEPGVTPAAWGKLGKYGAAPGGGDFPDERKHSTIWYFLLAQEELWHTTVNKFIPICIFFQLYLDINH